MKNKLGNIFKTKAPEYLISFANKYFGKAITMVKIPICGLYKSQFKMNFLSVIVVIAFFASCSNSENKLPIYGAVTVVGADSIHSSIQAFEFINQDSLVVTGNTFKNKIYVADFIFLSCPTICPLMNVEMKKVYNVFKSNPNVSFLSHTIDPKYDTIPRLKQFATDLGIDNSKWHFVTGDIDSIYAIAKNSYFATTLADSTAPGGFIHSGSFFLIDVNKQIRGVYNGTNPEETQRLITDLNILLTEQFNE